MNEDQIVQMIRKRYGGSGRGLIQGIGDDAAVLRPRGSREYWVITTDMLLEDVDFRRTWLTPAQLGHKALAVNLSDLAAMGAQPRYFTAALALPPGIRPSWIQACYQGMMRLARKHEALLIGGDLSRSPAGIQITITAIGTSAQKPILRSGGRPGDILFVTGVLGRAAAGLALLQRGRTRGNNPAERRALNSHLTPQPRCKAGMWLAGCGLVRGMMDLSDGISMDLARMCEACGTGAEIFGSRLPVFAAARGWQCDPVELALDGGEDFELLFAVSARKADYLEAVYPSRLPPIHRIGRLRRERGVFWRVEVGSAPRRLASGGFDHFRHPRPKRWKAGKFPNGTKLSGA
jgi:thiamine-monophosphate kinase